MTQEAPRPGRRAPRWSRRLRRLVTAVIVMNVALGLAFSVIGLRHMADDRAKVLTDLIHREAQATEIRGAVWRSIADGRMSAQLRAADPSGLTRSIEQHHQHGNAGSGGTLSAAQAFTVSVDAVRTALRSGEVARARGEAILLDTRLDNLLRQMQTVADAHQRESEQSSTIADVETALLMLFAAAIGLLLFRRTVAARVNGDLRAARERARASARFASLVSNSSDLISLICAEFSIVFQTESLHAVLGYATDDLAGTSLLDLVHPDDQPRFISAHDSLLAGTPTVSTTVRMRAADGGYRHIESVHTDMREDANVGQLVVTSRDVSERVELEDQLRHGAFHDSLTGLANRALFTDRVEHAIERRSRPENAPVVAFLDLDDFKAVNDTLGHRAGDELLIAVAQRLSAALRHGDTVARLGGDEFALLIEDLDDDRVNPMLERIRVDLREPLAIAGREVTVRVSMGVARYDGDADATRLLANADLAMYAAKGAGKNTVRRFTADMGDQVRTRLQIKTELHEALQSGHIHAYFQPTLDLASGRLRGFEALARWNHPERGTIMPGQFIPVAEQTGQIVEIGRTLLGQACRALTRWHARFPEQQHLAVSVNLSARELDEPDLLEHVAAVLAETGLRPDRLTLEVTESVLVSDPTVAKARLHGLRELGVRVAIDDFGTGYSSLSYLEELPIDIVKIDKSFVDRLVDGRPSVLVETITKLGTALGMDTVAEGIEHHAQADVLRDLGCGLGQGFLFSRAVPSEEIDALLVDRAGIQRFHYRPAVTPPPVADLHPAERVVPTTS